MSYPDIRWLLLGWRRVMTCFLLVSGLAPFGAPLRAAGGACYDDIRQAFIVPTSAAKPRAWWFWGESLTTEAGVTQDLEALRRVGFGGVVLYEQVFSDSPDALKSLSPEWLSRVRFAAA